MLLPYLNCIDRNGNLKLITLLSTVPVQIQANGIQEVLRSSSAAPSSIDLFLVLCKSLSSLSNPLWCSSVCWSRARVAWDYSDWGHTHTEVHSLYIHFEISPFYNVGHHRNVPGAAHIDCKGPI